MNWRVTRLGWLIAAIVIAVFFVWAMFFISDAISCGGLDSGPNPGAEQRFCGFAPNEPVDYSDLFVFVQLIPAIPVLIGGLLPSLGRSRLFFPAGVVLGVVCTSLIWALEP